MTIDDVRSRLSGRRRAPAGYPEVTETLHTRLSLSDHLALQGIRIMSGQTCTYSELIRAILQAAAADILPADPYSDLLSVEQLPGGGLLMHSAAPPITTDPPPTQTTGAAQRTGSTRAATGKAAGATATGRGHRPHDYHGANRPRPDSEGRGAREHRFLPPSAWAGVGS